MTTAGGRLGHRVDGGHGVGRGIEALLERFAEGLQTVLALGLHDKRPDLVVLPSGGISRPALGLQLFQRR